MTNAVLLSAGQGKRLGALTEDRPKCTVMIGERSLVEWQVRALVANGIEDITIVTGFRAPMIRAALDAAALPVRIEYLYNPFYSVADNIGSCWMARERLGEDSVLINGDTLFDPRILERVLARATAPISVTIDRKPVYDSDDMKVRLDGGRLTDIGKTLTRPIDGESIGMLRFSGAGGMLFRDKLEEVLADVAALKLWYLSIIDRIAKTGSVGFVDIEGLPWAEVDFAQDVESAAQAVAKFPL
ncbi:phosphocholine cytidylyltransferase family protein [Pikeienuella piscinae]|uniref:Phosphocholine cytidylyltransferase family protein n=1 Tax=Pikeienuella piscinae TaxID=2748098 RepID=A0A7L5BY75_9RHOB|nr:phosphocholine cytidylyltransferase family protein [Pikeienuella piscinae]QIE56875.1 phosphocholine cytidylyltransferase family protein [Pikeienuella piscinae]